MSERGRKGKVERKRQGIIPPQGLRKWISNIGIFIKDGRGFVGLNFETVPIGSKAGIPISDLEEIKEMIDRAEGRKEIPLWITAMRFYGNDECGAIVFWTTDRVCECLIEHPEIIKKLKHIIREGTKYRPIDGAKEIYNDNFCFEGLEDEDTE